MSVNDEAALWLEEIGASHAVSADAVNRSWVAAESGRPEQPGIPSSVVALVARARAVAEGYETGPARLRLRGRSGQWLVLHASCMSSADSAAGTVAVVIEPAKSTEIAPIIVDAYALTARERDVVRAIARGMSGPEIVAELYLSPHTVRDHVKAVFEKAGVSSRAELVSKLFADHYTDALHTGAVQAF